jgi:hypothetical protein
MCMELGQDHVQWRTSVLVALNFRILLSDGEIAPFIMTVGYVLLKRIGQMFGLRHVSTHKK